MNQPKKPTPILDVLTMAKAIRRRPWQLYFLAFAGLVAPDFVSEGGTPLPKFYFFDTNERRKEISDALDSPALKSWGEAEKRLMIDALICGQRDEDRHTLELISPNPQDEYDRIGREIVERAKDPVCAKWLAKPLREAGQKMREVSRA